ncbi:GPO family capsid scaffolding protein [Neisseria lactamica]|uniref:GPO family capsid scaffolding protein n=1 Tax=Neisseria lactamica TaxID=486 RepID=UPI000E56C1DF|nr:GPO family capsid scaffolding protein [Neisseria lactamica]
MPYTKKTDWRVIGVSGDTVDGRTISERELREMAESYDPDVYGARINLEHITFIIPDFISGYGDVVELKAEPWKKDPSKTALLARLNITPELQRLWDSGQKIYTSMEITPDFADTRKAYLTGLAITDTPASLGTTANYTAAKHRAGEKFFSAYRADEPKETVMNENQNDPALTEQEAEGIFARLFKKYFAANAPAEPEAAANKAVEPEAAANKAAESEAAAEYALKLGELTEKYSRAAALFDKLDGEIEAARAETAALRAEFDAFKADIDTRPASGNRLDHTGTAEGIRW